MAATPQLLTRIKAIRARCLDCAENTAEVRRCAFTDCSLWPYRMAMNPSRARRMGYEVGDGPNAAQRAVKVHCLWCSAGNEAERRQCEAYLCPLWAFRLGKPVAIPPPPAPARSQGGLRRILRRDGTLAHLVDVEREKRTQEAPHV